MSSYFRARTLLFSIIAPNTQFLAHFSSVSQWIALIVGTYMQRCILHQTAQSDFEPGTQFEFCLPTKAILRWKSVRSGFSLGTFFLPKSEHVGSQMVPVSESGLVLAL